VVVFVAIVPPYPTCPFWILVIALHQSQYSNYTIGMCFTPVQTPTS